MRKVFDVYQSDYEAFDLYVSDFSVGAKAFVFNKDDEEWSEGIVADIIESDKLADGEIPFVTSYTGEIITADESYYVGIETEKTGIEKPELNIIGYC